jgi:hypothetical protein
MGYYMRALLNSGSMDGNRIFGDEALAMLLERQASAHPFSRGRSYAFTELTLSGRKVLYHDGNGIGLMSRIVLVPEHDLGILSASTIATCTRGCHSPRRRRWSGPSAPRS